MQLQTVSGALEQDISLKDRAVPRLRNVPVRIAETAHPDYALVSWMAGRLRTAYTTELGRR
eukprot:12264578-Alexandrium_andersonii.AAC.1